MWLLQLVSRLYSTRPEAPQASRPDAAGARAEVIFDALLEAVLVRPRKRVYCTLYKFFARLQGAFKCVPTGAMRKLGVI